MLRFPRRRVASVRSRARFKVTVDYVVLQCVCTYQLVALRASIENLAAENTLNPLAWFRLAVLSFSLFLVAGQARRLVYRPYVCVYVCVCVCVCVCVRV